MVAKLKEAGAVSSGGDALVDLLSRLLVLDPARRMSAKEVTQHQYFQELEPIGADLSRLQNSLPELRCVLRTREACA